MLDLHTCYLSEQGGRSRNEDACGYWTSEAGGCWVVSDGAGGHGSGDIASRLAVSTVLRRFSAHPVVAPDEAVALLQAANEMVVTEKTNGDTADDMHATAVALLIDPRQRGRVGARGRFADLPVPPRPPGLPDAGPPAWCRT